MFLFLCFYRYSCIFIHFCHQIRFIFIFTKQATRKRLGRRLGRRRLYEKFYCFNYALNLRIFHVNQKILCGSHIVTRHFKIFSLRRHLSYFRYCIEDFRHIRNESFAYENKSTEIQLAESAHKQISYTSKNILNVKEFCRSLKVETTSM